MFYKSSLLAVTVVLLSAGNVFALDTSEAIGNDVSWMQNSGLDHQSLVVGDISLSIAAKNTGIDAVKSRLIGKDAGSVEMRAEKKNILSSKLVKSDYAAEHSFSVDPSVVQASSMVAKVPRAAVELGGTKSLVVADDQQRSADSGVVANEPENRVEVSVVPDVLSVNRDSSVIPVEDLATSLELDLTKKWEITDAVTLNEVLLTPPSVRMAQAVGESVSVEPKKWAVGIHAQASTTGFVGADVGYKFSPNFHARLGVNAVGFNTNYSSQGIDYNASFSPTNVHFLGDYFPFGGGLRLTGGLVVQSNQFNGTGKSSSSTGQITLGGATYNASDVGTVSSEGSFSNSVAPYLGIGFGTPLSPGLGFNLDAGVMFAGSPTVRLRANNISPLVPAQQIRDDLAKQESQTNKDISGFNVYPVISIGFSYAF
jgi:hypothetical protein